jgi:hypothetical protein
MTNISLAFTEVAPLGPQPAGGVGGDYQSTEAYSRRFAAPLADGTYAMITINVFGEFYDADQRELRKPAGPHVLTSLTEYMVTTDTADLSVSLIGGDLVYARINVGVLNSPVTDGQAHAACAALPVPAWPERLAWQLPAGPLGTSGNEVRPRTDADIAWDEQSREHAAALADDAHGRVTNKIN